MKKFLAVLFYCLPVYCLHGLGQAAYSGPALYSGSGTYVASSVSCAAPNFCAYNGVDLIPTPTAPNFSTSANGLTNNGATAYDTSYLGHKNFDGTNFSSAALLSPITRITDAYSAPDFPLANHTAGMGGSGVFTLTNLDTSLVGIDDSSKERVCLFNTSGSLQGRCSPIHSGIFITTDLCVTNGNYTCPTGSSGQTQDFGSISFSLTDKTKLFTFGNDSYDISSPTTVCPYSVNPGTGAYSLLACVVDFKYGLPAYNASNWAASTNYSYGAYVIHPLAASEMSNGTGTWVAGVAVVAGDLIASGSPACMYKATTGGTTAGTTPGFITNGACKIDTVKESSTGGGAVVWKGTASQPQFLFQDTTSGTHTSGSSFAISGHPDFFSTFSDAAITWTNLGPAYVPTGGGQLWNAIGGITRDVLYSGNPSQYGIAISTNTYGLTPKYSYQAGQGTGIWALEYDNTLAHPTYHLLNTATGIWTDYVCGSGNGFTCSGITANVVGTLLAISNPQASGQYGTSGINPGQVCPSFLHNEKITANGQYVELVFNPELYSACNSLENFAIWTTNSSSFDANNSLQYTHDGMTHWATGTNKVVAFHGSTFRGGYSSGAFLSVYNAASANTAPVFSTELEPLGSACANPPNGAGCIPQNTPPTPPGCYQTSGTTTENPDCSISDGFDSHLSWVGDPGTDTYPVCGTTYNAATLGPAWNAWQNMETCYPTTPTYCDPNVETCPQGSSTATGVSVNPPWQFTHTFATGASTTFSTQFQISQYSQDANWLFWSSDWDCQNGSTSGSAPAVWTGGTYYQMLMVTPVPANPSSLCGLPWAASTAYVAGNRITPIEGTGGSSAVDDVFQALTSGITGPESTLSNNQPSCLVFVGGTLQQGSCFANTNPPTVTPLTITAVSEAGTTGTITVSSPGLTLNNGTLVTLAGFTGSDTGWNGTFAVTGMVGANCPGSACGPVTTFQLTGMPSGLSTPGSYSGAAATAQGDTVCDLTNPGQDSINASSCAGVTWGDIGPQTQRGDVFAVNLGNQR